LLKKVWKETFILKLGFGAIFGLLSLLGLIPLFMGFYFGARFLSEPVRFEWMGGTVTTSVIIVNQTALISGIATAILYWIILSCQACGSEITKADAIFCPYCGRKISAEITGAYMERGEFTPLSSFLQSLYSSI